MKAVNLLPEDLRPRRSSERMSGSSYALIGALVVLLAMAVGYVMTSNSINSKKTDIASAQQETAAAKARVAELQPYQEFAQIKATRIASVRELASQRFDWERMMREVALVLPPGTSVTELNATTPTATPTTGTPSGAPPAPPTPAAGVVATGPTLQLKGCAERQPDVATLMVRLRGLYGAADVTLTESTEPIPDPGDVSKAAQASTPGSGDGCPADLYKFDVSVSFSPTATGDEQGSGVPARLGGGA